MDRIWLVAVVAAIGISASLILSAGLRILVVAFRNYRERYGLKDGGDWLEFLLFVDRQGLHTLSMGTAAVLALVGALTGGMALGLLGSVLGWILPLAVVRRQRTRWRLAVEKQLVPALEGLAAALRGGLSLPQALERIAGETPGPLGKELRFLLRETKLGHSLEGSLDALAVRIESSEFDLTVAAIVLSRQQGGNLAEMLARAVDVLRERFRLEGKVLALTAQGRMQGRVVAAMPACLGAILWWMRPDLVEPMVRHPFGQLLLLTVAVLDVAGLIWMGRLVRVDV